MTSVVEKCFKNVATAMGTLLLAGSVFAQTYPTKPVSLLVPYPAGGLSDVIARTVNNTLSKNLGQPVIVDNLGGASGSIAAQKVLNAPSDGQIIFQGSPNELILAPLALSAVKFKSEDFRLVHFDATSQARPGDFVDLEITDASTHYLIAKELAHIKTRGGDVHEARTKQGPAATSLGIPTLRKPIASE